jgi:hypothetical protein
MQKIWSVIVREVREAIPAMVFFFIAFHVVVFTKGLILEDYDITPTSSIVATIGALIVAKAILIADKLPLVNLFANRAIIIGVIWRTLIYLLIVSVFRYIEELIPLHAKYGDWGSANRHLIDETSWPHFWAIQIWITLLLFLYCTLVEFIRAIGAVKVKTIFFGGGRGDTC